MAIDLENHSHKHPIQTIPLDMGKSLNVQPGSMHACKNVEVNTRINGSVWNAAKLYFFGGESIYVNTFTANSPNAWLALEEGYRGQVAHYQLSPNEKLYLQKGAYVASDANVRLRTEYAGFSSLAKGLSLCKITASVCDESKGRVFFDTKFGMIKEIKITKEDGPVTVDNDHIIGYTGGLSMTLKKLGRVSTLFFSGEGLVNEVSGNGTVFVGTTTTVNEKRNVIQQLVQGTFEKLVEQFYDGNISAIAIIAIAAKFVLFNSRVADVLRT